MTDNDKMREAFIQACKEYGPTISFSDFEMGWDACMAWQAAQSVPVVGEPVAWRWSESDGSRFFDWRGDNWDHHDKALKEGFVIQYAYPAPTTSIPAAELERLRRDAARYRWLRDSPESPIINVGYATDKMVDAAIAQGKGE